MFICLGLPSKYFCHRKQDRIGRSGRDETSRADRSSLSFSVSGCLRRHRLGHIFGSHILKLQDEGAMTYRLLRSQPLRRCTNEVNKSKRAGLKNEAGTPDHSTM